MKLYRHFDRHGTLLYVGVSLSAVTRMRGHRNVSSWYDQITRVEIETYRTRREALDAEKKAILLEGPLYNIASTRKLAHILLGLRPAPNISQEQALQLGQAQFRAMIDIANDVPRNIAEQGQRHYRHEFIRRLSLRGWRIIRAVRLEPGSRGSETHRYGRLDILAYPPSPAAENLDQLAVRDYPMLVEIERHRISYRTRAKIQAYGSRPHRGVLFIVLYGGQNHVRPPEATEIVCLHHIRDGADKWVDEMSSRA